MTKKEIAELNARYEGKAPREILEDFLPRFRGRIAFATSMGAEDQVLTQMIVSIDPEVRIFTLDTGRLFQETYDLIERTKNRYKINIELMFPDTEKVQDMVREKGINLFYESVENRKLCCFNRKIEPLHRALEGFDAWITGLRRDQSVTRNEATHVAVDENNHGRIKLNPLIDWSMKEVWDYIKTHNIPYHKLHDKGFPSIGCLPCTRAIEPGEDIRAGRWWWEQPEHKECGLHRR